MQLQQQKQHLKKGIVPGGGVTLLRARKVLEKLLKDLKIKGDERVGINILYDSLSEPIKKIAENAGSDPFSCS